MGAGSSIGGGPRGSPVVTVEQASEIMSIVFSKQVTHDQLREFLATARRDMLDADTVQLITAVLDRAAALQREAAAPQVRQCPPCVGGARALLLLLLPLMLCSFCCSRGTGASVVVVAVVVVVVVASRSCVAHATHGRVRSCR